MKAVQLAVLLLIVCVSCEALRCNHCLMGRAGAPCTNTVEECKRPDDVCISVLMGHPLYSYFRRCSKRVEAEIMKANQYLTVTICETDLCN